MKYKKRNRNTIPRKRFFGIIGRNKKESSKNTINKSVDKIKSTLPTIKEQPVSIEDKDGVVIATFINMYFAEKFLNHCVEGENYHIKQ